MTRAAGWLPGLGWNGCKNSGLPGYSPPSVVPKRLWVYYNIPIYPIFYLPEEEYDHRTGDKIIGSESNCFPEKSPHLQTVS